MTSHIQMYITGIFRLFKIQNTRHILRILVVILYYLEHIVMVCILLFAVLYPPRRLCFSAIRPFQVFSMFSVRGRIGFKLWKVKQNTLNKNLTCTFDLDRNYENTINKMFIRLSVSCIQRRELSSKVAMTDKYSTT
jgi:hypothetical protein